MFGKLFGKRSRVTREPDKIWKNEARKLDGLLAALARVLPMPTTQRAQDAPEWDFKINLLVTEHHPHPDLDDRVLRFAENLPCPVRICFHDSLDSALIRHFGGTNIERVMTALNMPEGEAISHAMIEKSIRAAQEKIKKQAKRNLFAESAELWIKQNLQAGL